MKNARLSIGEGSGSRIVGRIGEIEEEYVRIGRKRTRSGWFRVGLNRIYRMGMRRMVRAQENAAVVDLMAEFPDSTSVSFRASVGHILYAVTDGLRATVQIHPHGPIMLEGKKNKKLRTGR